MKKITLILAMFVFSISAKSQISFNNIGTAGTFPYYIGATKIGNSSYKETSNQYLSSSLDSVKTFGVLKIKSKAATAGGAVLFLHSSDATQLFRINNNGAIYTGTVQAVETSSFVAGSNTITVTNGLITNVQ